MLQHYFKKKYILILLHLLVLSSECHRKPKKARALKISPPKYEIFSSNTLPSDVQVTKYLMKGQEEVFSYLSTLVNGTISVSIIPCTSIIQWSFIYSGENLNTTGKFQERNEIIESNTFLTRSFISQQGLYFLSLKALENETYVHIYISTEIGGPHALKTLHSENLRIYEKEKRKCASVKWNPSLVDPQSTDYCLVVSTKSSYKSLCAAQAATFALKTPQNQKLPQKPVSDSQTVIRWEPSTDKYFEQQDPIIACTGKKTHYTIPDLKEGQTYHYSLFAINKQSNLTYPYGSVTTVFRRKTKPVALKRGFGQANLKKFGEKTVFKYKIGRDIRNTWDIFVIPCGGPVDVKIMLKGETVLTSRKIEGFRKLTVKNPRRGGRYFIKIFPNSREDWRRTTGVEIYASSKVLSSIPMITQPKLEEYVSMRGCHTATIGWLLVPESHTLHYCVEIREGKLKDMEDYKNPNQCGLENRLRKSVDFDSKYCEDIKGEESQKNGGVKIYTIKKLKPGKNYIVQVTVKKPAGKTLSYDLLQISRKKCGKHLN